MVRTIQTQHNLQQTQYTQSIILYTTTIGETTKINKEVQDLFLSIDNDSTSITVQQENHNQYQKHWLNNIDVVQQKQRQDNDEDVCDNNNSDNDNDNDNVDGDVDNNDDDDDSDKMNIDNDNNASKETMLSWWKKLDAVDEKSPNWGKNDCV